MLGENKNLKDSIKDHEEKSLTSYGTGTSKTPFAILSYTKTNKLITALYMVTDTMEKDEPIRLKLRTLGVEILSDINMSKGTFDMGKMEQILSFLNIAFEVRMISEMNFNILMKEFTELRQSILDYTKQNHSWLEEFLISPDKGRNEEGLFSSKVILGNGNPSKGQGTRIGVQKGGTLLKALSEVEGMDVLKKNNGHTHHQEFEMQKNKRRQDIISIIKNTKSVDGATITDIKTNSNGLLENCGEKTLQRELVSMVKDNVLYKTGEKRWSRYFVK